MSALPRQVELETEQEELENLCAGPNLRNSKKLGASSCRASKPPATRLR